MRAVVFTLGCKVNEAESAKIAAALEKMGIQTDFTLSRADIYVLNTCAVTREAEKKSRQLVTRVKKLNPDAKIFVCGCASQKDKSQFLDRGVYYICGTADKESVIGAVAELIERQAPCGDIYAKQAKTRAFIKIQDGCNNFCSYCIIPYLRGREKSRSPEDIKGEILVCDCPEAVINGINISSYDYGGKDLGDLILSLSDVDKRIRLGSLECGIITEKFLSALKGLKDFAPQFHLSLQSGSNAVLKAMNRHYTREEYLEKCALIYKYFPDAAITTDIIAGFPTETEEDFKLSLNIIKEAGFARVHCFEFSPREGTVAAKLKDIPPEIKKSRLKKLIAAAEEGAKNYALKYIGKTVSFIAEEFDGEYTSGYSANYMRVYVKGQLKAGGMYGVKILNLFNDGVTAEVV